MIVILYDNECDITHRTALRIKEGIEREIVPCYLMTLDDIDITRLTLARCIIFGCRSGFSGGVTNKMSRFMERTRGEFENQIWKNKFASGFTVNTGVTSKDVIEELCNFAAKHTMIWIPQGHLAENEGHHAFENNSRARINSNKSYLGCIATIDQSDLTPAYFGRRIGRQVHLLLNLIRS
jgi:multimeric flavodoxin WrbA